MASSNHGEMSVLTGAERELWQAYLSNDELLRYRDLDARIAAVGQPLNWTQVGAAVAVGAGSAVMGVGLKALMDKKPTEGASSFERLWSGGVEWAKVAKSAEQLVNGRPEGFAGRLLDGLVPPEGRVKNKAEILAATTNVKDVLRGAFERLSPDAQLKVADAVSGAVPGGATAFLVERLGGHVANGVGVSSADETQMLSFQFLAHATSAIGLGLMSIPPAVPMAMAVYKGGRLVIIERRQSAELIEWGDLVGVAAHRMVDELSSRRQQFAWIDSWYASASFESNIGKFEGRRGNELLRGRS